jgi:hypothetical protein
VKKGRREKRGEESRDMEETLLWETEHGVIAN